MKNIKLFSVIAAFLLTTMFSIFAAAESLRDPGEFFFDQSFGDLPDELSACEDEGKQGLLIMFETNDCPWCERMKETVLNRQSVQEIYKENFRTITVNIEGDGPIVNFDGVEISEKEFALTYNRVRATPVFAFFNTDGELMTKYTGATRDVDEFVWLAEYVAQGHYKNQKFVTYKRAKRSTS